MHEVTDLSIQELRDLMGDRRQKYRFSDVHEKPRSEEVKGEGAAQRSWTKLVACGRKPLLRYVAQRLPPAQRHRAALFCCK
jgi:hypothetical protein